jgi:hypothetical protein
MRDVATIWLATLLVLAPVVPASADSPRIAQIKTVAGEAAVIRGNARLPARPGDPLYESDVIETGPAGTIGITFIDNTVFSAGPGSELALSKFHFDSRNRRGELQAEMRHGTLNVVSGDITKSSPEATKIKTPTAVLGVSGTTFAVKIY